MIWPFRRKRWQLQGYVLPFGGQERHYLLYEPRRTDVSTPLPLILALHGGGGNPKAMSRRTQLHEIAGRKGYLVAYPAGRNRRGRRRLLNWNSGGRYGVSWADRSTTSSSRW